MNKKNIDFKKISISSKSNKKIQKNGEIFCFYDILYNNNISYDLNEEKVPLNIEFNQEEIGEHDIEFLEKSNNNKDDFELQLNNIIRISKKTEVTKKHETFLEWIRSLERHVLGLAYDENLFPVEINDLAAAKLASEIE